MAGSKVFGTARTVALLVMLLALTSASLRAAPITGDLDKSFGGDGRVLTELPGDTMAEDAFVTRSGHILVVGRKNLTRILVLRYRPDGRLDKTFSGNGWLTTDAMENPESTKILVGRRGVIFVVATSNQNFSNRNFAVMKLSPRGVVKTDFGRGGVLTVNFGGDDRVRAVARAARGKFYAAGMSHDGQGNTAIARFNADGRLDTNSDANPSAHWGEDGKVVIDEGDGALGAKSLRNGKLLIGSARNRYDDIYLSRFTRHGEPDSTFHGIGEIASSMGGDIDHIENMTFAPGVMYAGANVVVGAEADVRVGRFTLLGEADQTFDEDGRNDYDLGGSEQVTKILEADNGKPVLVGTSEVNASLKRWFVMRLRRDGTRDPSFGNNGVVFTRFHPNAEMEHSSAQDLDIQDDGKFLVTGYSILNDLDWDSALARFR